jgi:hypothetical protein
MTLPQEHPQLQQEAAQPWSAPEPRRAYLQSDPRLRSPVVATLLSGMPGLGQVYLGYYKDGFINIIVAASLCAILARHGDALGPLLGTFLAFFWLYNMVDAGRRAALLNLAINRVEAPNLPEGFGSVGVRGQLFGGLALVVVGILALAHLRFGMPLEWLATWWPAALVLVGIYLVWQAAAERK